MGHILQMHSVSSQKGNSKNTIYVKYGLASLLPTSWLEDASLGCLVKNGRLDNSFMLYDEMAMIWEGLSPDPFTYITVWHFDPSPVHVDIVISILFVWPGGHVF
jgi:hypothetical protein